MVHGLDYERKERKKETNIKTHIIVTFKKVTNYTN